jgi:hypothetical protein
VNIVKVTFSVTAVVDSEFTPDKHADDIISTARRVFAPAEVEALGMRISPEGQTTATISSPTASK